MNTMPAEPRHYDEPHVNGPRDVARLRPFLADLWKPGKRFWRMAASNTRMGGGADNYAAWDRTTLERATLWWVSEEMMDLLEAAARTVPDDVTMNDLPHIDASGFAVFARPWIGHGVTGEPLHVNAILWGPARLPANIPSRRLRHDYPDGALSMSVAAYAEYDLDAGLGPNELQAATPIITDKLQRGELRADEFPPADGNRAYSIHGNLWGPLGRSDWIIGEQVGQVDYVEELELSRMPVRQYLDLDRVRDPNDDTASETIMAEVGKVMDSYVEDRKLLIAFWTLVHQAGIAEATILRPPRHEARRAQREGYGRDGADVRVVTLRRPERTESEPGEHEPEHREWSCHWIVNGHWRSQPFGPGRTQRRLQWIDAYTKGDMDKPLRKPVTVRAWKR